MMRWGLIIISPLIGEQCRPLLWWACLSVCSSAHISHEPESKPLKFLCVCYLRRGLVLFRRLCDTLCPSGFVDDVMFAHTRNRWKKRKLKLPHQWQHQTGAESDVYDSCCIIACHPVLSSVSFVKNCSVMGLRTLIKVNNISRPYI